MRRTGASHWPRATGGRRGSFFRAATVHSWRAAAPSRSVARVRPTDGTGSASSSLSWRTASCAS
eukprot:3512368-Pyramimonas_sp.AAC.1